METITPMQSMPHSKAQSGVEIYVAYLIDYGFYLLVSSRWVLDACLYMHAHAHVDVCIYMYVYCVCVFAKNISWNGLVCRRVVHVKLIHEHNILYLCPAYAYVQKLKLVYYYD